MEREETYAAVLYPPALSFAGSIVRLALYPYGCAGLNIPSEMPCPGNLPVSRDALMQVGMMIRCGFGWEVSKEDHNKTMCSSSTCQHGLHKLVAVYLLGPQYL